MTLVRRGLTVVVAVLVAGTAISREAHAQTEKTPDGPWSAQVDGALTVGHRTSGAAGVELGWWPSDELKLFVESSWMQDVASSALDERAKIIADAIGAVPDMQQAATAVAAGVRYSLRAPGAWRPFVLGGFGFARVNVKPGFLINDTDVTDSLAGTYGVRLGSDLDGRVNKPYMLLGAGANVPLTSRYFIEGSLRYGRIFPRGSAIPNDAGTNTQRLQVSFGARF